MTGQEIRQLRAQLGLNAGQFAELLGVARSTVYRWETTSDAAVIDLHQRRLLDAMHAHLAHAELRRVQQLGTDLADVLVAGGGLRALHVLLSRLYGARGPASA